MSSVRERSYKRTKRTQCVRPIARPMAAGEYLLVSESSAGVAELLKKKQKMTEDVRAVRVRERKYRHVYYPLNPKSKKSSKNGKVLKASSSRGMVTDIDGKRRSLQKT